MALPSRAGKAWLAILLPRAGVSVGTGTSARMEDNAHMTQQKKLKQLIRSRMDKTGESYTTARRNVLAKAPAPSPLSPALSPALAFPGVVPGYPAFGALQHHESGLLAHVLQARGITAPHTGGPFTEAMLAGIGGGIGFMYAIFEYREMPPLLTIVAQHHPAPWAPTVLNGLGITHREQHSGKPVSAMARLRDTLAQGTPAITTVDRSRLPWHGLDPGYGTDPYVVVAAGCDGDTVYVDDEGPVPRSLGMDQFAGAWSAHRKGRHHLLTVTGDRPARDLPEAIREAIAMTIGHLTGPVLGHAFDSNFGFSGMAKLAAQLRDTRTKQGWLRRFSGPVPLFHGLRRLYECLELEYTAPGATRPIYADFLTEAAPIVGGHLTEAAALVRESGDTWSRLATLAHETVTGLGAYTEVAEERLALMFSQAPDVAARVRVLNERLAGLVGEPLGEQVLRDLFAEMAALVEACLALEKRAVAILSS